MAVIYLPPNPNMVALGRGLGNIAGGFSQGLIRDQVQKIMQMPGTLEQKLPLLYRVGGPQAVQFAKQMATLQTQGLQQKALQAQTAGETAKTAYQKLLTQQAPQELALRGQQVGYQGIEAKSSELQAQAAQQNALANQARASAAVATSGAQRDELEAQAKLHEVELMKSLFQLRLMQTPGGMSNALYGNVDPLTGQPIAKPAGSIPSVPPIGVTPTGGIPSMAPTGPAPTGLAPTGL
ncbi:MAG: hypothetical protein ACREBW_00085, partial [Candidatus Micrarchaeaceae archaeon]